jgi:drug/metabolite transporter (DMT)-like permease
MMDNLDASMLALIGFCVLTETGREVCFKFSATGSASNPFLRPSTIMGVGFWAVELLAWIYVLANVPLSVAFPLMASSYTVIALSGALIFKEKLNWRHFIGVALVTTGVLCVGATGL